MQDSTMPRETQYIIRGEPIWRRPSERSGRPTLYTGTRWFETLSSAMSHVKLYKLDPASLIAIPPASTLAELVPCPHSSYGDTRKRWEVVQGLGGWGRRAKTRREAIRAEADVTDLLCEVCTGQRPASHTESGRALLRAKLMED